MNKKIMIKILGIIVQVNKEMIVELNKLLPLKVLNKKYNYLKVNTTKIFV